MPNALWLLLLSLSLSISLSVCLCVCVSVCLSLSLSLSLCVLCVCDAQGFLQRQKMSGTESLTHRYGGKRRHEKDTKGWKERERGFGVEGKWSQVRWSRHLDYFPWKCTGASKKANSLPTPSVVLSFTRFHFARSVFLYFFRSFSCPPSCPTLFTVFIFPLFCAPPTFPPPTPLPPSLSFFCSFSLSLSVSPSLWPHSSHTRFGADCLFIAPVVLSPWQPSWRPGRQGAIFGAAL